MPRSSPSRFARALRFLERVLLVIALVAFGAYAAVQVAAAREQASLSRELENATHAVRAPVHAAARPAARTWRGDKPATATIARLEIPRVNLSAAAREGIDVGTLRTAVGHIPGTAQPGDAGNAGFAGHRDTFFRPLRDVRPGDDVIVTTPEGVYRYTVTRTRVVEPGDLSVLDPTPRATLTLVTCYPFSYIGPAPKRFVVFAERLERF